LSEFKEELEADVRDEEGLTLKDRAFLAFLAGEAGGDVRRAMDLAGFPKDMPIYTITKRLKKQIQDISKDYLASHTLKASIDLLGVLKDPTAMGSKNVIAAAKEILDRGGINKEENINIQTEKNMFILPAKKGEEDDEE
jgi:hypothetical protein